MYSKTCPHCKSEELPKDEQPYSSLHAFSIKYSCGSQVVYVSGNEYWEWEKSCLKEIDDV